MAQIAHRTLSVSFGGSLPRVSVIDRRRVVHLAKWAASLVHYRDLLRADEPWVTFHALEWLERVIRPEMRVAEFGSGASTLYWAKRVSEVVAVEHHPKWHAHLSRVLEEDGVRNCEYILAEAKPLNGSAATAKKHGEPGATRSLKKGYEEQDFEKYASALDGHADGSFDVVFVDGRARVACAERAVSKVKRGGYLVLDNAERPRYEVLRERFGGYRRMDLTSMGPRQVGRWTTSVWRVR